MDIHTPANATARPIQPTFHSQNLRRKTCDVEGLAPAGAAVPGTIAHAPSKIMTAGAKTDANTRVFVVTVSFSVKGNEIVGSARENGWWFGVTL